MINKNKTLTKLIGPDGFVVEFNQILRNHAIKIFKLFQVIGKDVNLPTYFVKPT